VPEPPAIVLDRISDSMQLRHLTAEEKKILAQYLAPFDFEPECYLWHKDDQCIGIYLLTHGNVEISMENTGFKEIIVPEFGNGFLGESGYFGPKIWGHSSVKALTKCNGVFLPSDRIAEFQTNQPELAHKFERCMFKSVSDKLESANQRILSLRHNLNLVMKKVEELPGIQQARTQVDDILGELLSPDMALKLEFINQIPEQLWPDILEYVKHNLSG